MAEKISNVSPSLYQKKTEKHALAIFVLDEGDVKKRIKNH